MKIPFVAFTERYAFCDPAAGRKNQQLKRVRARSAVIVVAPDDLMRLFVLYAWADRCATDKLTDQVLQVNETFKPRVFGVEANAMQSLYADAVRREARHQKKRLPLTAVYQSTRIDKDFRIRSVLQPIIAGGRLFVRDDMYELKSELLAFPLGATKDLIDALASAISLVPNRTTAQQRDTEHADLARYLRETGAPAWYIEQRIRELQEASKL